jgi:prevent-host-death family protein
MQPVKAEEFSGSLSELAKQAARGEEVVLTVDGEPIAQIVPMQRRKPREFGSGAGMITIAADFDEPLDDFKDYQ